MAKIRKIDRDPRPDRNYFIVDANFLANKFIPPNRTPDTHQRKRITDCRAWWSEIDAQLDRGRARVYVPDIAVAETFKTLAKKYYDEKWYRSSQDYHYWRTQLRNTISLAKEELRKKDRRVRYHDIESSRDIMIAVDRFYELFFKHGKKVSLPDLLVVATAKYLVDFFDFPLERLHIVTLDRPLRDGSKKIQELPNAYDPTFASDAAARVFK